MTQTILRVVVVAGLVIAAVPAAAANKEHQQLMADIRMLQEQAQQLQNILGALNESIKAVNARLDDQTNITRKAFADQKLIIDTLGSDSRVTREKLDDNNVRLGSLSQELNALRQAIDQLSTRSTPTTSPDTDPAAAPGGTTSPATGAAPVVAVSPQKMQDSAMADYAIGEYDLAIEGFQAYIKNFPRSDWADDAQVNICNAYINQGKYDKAVDACDTAIRTYPNTNSVPEAYYRKGLALKQLKQFDRAREALEYVLKTYPDTQAAILAQQTLAQLGARQN
jgi:tol-pal system protein YbgF